MGLSIKAWGLMIEEADQTEVFPDTPAQKDSSVDKAVM